LLTCFPPVLILPDYINQFFAPAMFGIGLVLREDDYKNGEKEI